MLQGFLTRVLRERVRWGLVAGAIAAAATAGALLGLGRARGSPFTLLNDAAHVLIGERARLVGSAHAVVTSLAMIVHVAVILIWGVLFALLAGSLRGWRLVLAAVGFVAAVAAMDFWILPASLRPGFETAMSVPELVLLYAILAGALAFGVSVSRRTGSLA
jgi:hypothetical protein